MSNRSAHRDGHPSISKTEIAGGLAVVVGGIVLLCVVITPVAGVSWVSVGAALTAVGSGLLFLAR